MEFVYELEVQGGAEGKRSWGGHRVDLIVHAASQAKADAAAEKYRRILCTCYVRGFRVSQPRQVFPE